MNSRPIFVEMPCRLIVLLSSFSLFVGMSFCAPAFAAPASAAPASAASASSKSTESSIRSAASSPLTKEEKESPLDAARNLNGSGNFARSVMVLQANIDANTKSPIHITVPDWHTDSSGQNLALRELSMDQLRNIHYSDVYNLLGLTYYRLRQGAEAEASLLKSASLNPQNGTAFSNLSSIYLKFGRVDDSIAAANKALKISDRFLDAHRDLSMAYRIKRKFDLERKELDAYNQQRKLAVAEKLNRSSLGRAYYMYSLVSKKAPSAKRSVALGVINQQFQNYTEAEKCFVAAINLNSKLPEAYWAYGLLLVAEKRFADAAKQFSQAITLDPSFATLYLNRASAYSMLKKDNEAIADFTKCLELGGKPSVLIESHWGRATSEARLKQYAAGIKDLNKVLTFKIAPGIKAAILSERGAMYEGLGNKNQALKDCEAAMALAPDSKVISAQRGKMMLSLGEYEQATIDIGQSNKSEVSEVSKEPPSVADLKAQIEHYDKLIKMFPKTAVDSIYNRGLLYLTMGDAAKASADMQAVVAQAKESNSTADYAVCYGSIALKMQKKTVEANKLLQDYGKKVRHDSAPPEVRYFLNRAQSLAPVQVSGSDVKQKTRMLTLIGLDAYASNNKDLALSLLSSVRNTGDPSMDEFALAVSYLKRLGKN